MAQRETTGFLIKLISERITKNINQQLKHYGVTLLSQTRILDFLAGQCDHSATQKEIEDFLHVTHPTVIGILKVMMRNDLVECVRGEQGRRKKLVRLTSRSLEILGALQLSAHELQSDAFAGFSGDELDALSELLNRLYDNIKND